IALGMHNRPEIAVGRFGIVRGPTTASTDRFEIRVEGKGGHSARPFLANDPIVAAAQLVMQISTIVSNNVNAFHACAIAVGAIHAGKVHNVIPDTCELIGTVRSREPEARKAAEESLRRLCAGIEITAGVKCHLLYKYGVPALINDDTILEPTVKAIRAQLGDVADDWVASMGGEDFSLVAERVPAFRLLVGSSQPGRADKVHTPTYQPAEESIGYGVRALSRAAVELLA
ncbi:M20 metallopeptidase family protein, partial [Microvirga brassicacearum]